MSQFTKRVTNNEDDGWKGSSSGWSYEYGAILGNYSDIDVATAGIRFTAVNVPKDAQITSAYLKCVSMWSDTVTVLTKIGGIAEDNTAIMSSDPTGRTQTTAKVDWDIVNLVADTEYTSPDIKTIVQEIVNRAGWASGNAMGFIIPDDGSAQYNSLIAKDCVNYPNEAFQLVINYVVSSASPSVSPSASKSPSISPSPSPSLSPSVSPSVSPSGVHSYSPSVSPSISLSPSLSPSMSPSYSPSVSPSVSLSPSKSPSVSPSRSLSPSVSPSVPLQWGIRVKKPSVKKNVDEITDPKELVFTSAYGVLGLRLLDTVTDITDANGDISVTLTHNIGYPVITIVTAVAYDGNRVNLPVEWHSIYMTLPDRYTIEVTETFNFDLNANTVNITLHAEEYNHDLDTTSNISGREYTFKVYCYFNELVETY